ncbi:hypothetical protein B0H17DRAFT_124054 [Mycena rosella]|uniref:F-box domain-containing protein n=1 Tax=Mycena rosella TaxID=1033263 RepID=A0AAD7D3A3_MYCRO|nr:hypothetical protein B0H17DRAFT_124054 [Mycena rosella]
MRTPLSPLDLPELIDYCVEFLRDSVSDLKRCALVSRLWVNSAQARLFHNIRITSRERSGNERAWSCLEGILRISPHLVRHIHRLEVDSDAYSNKEEVLSAICCFPFTHLEDVCIIHISLLSLPLALAIQQLLSLCTLRRLKLSLHFDQQSLFLQMWDHCSPSLGHLELYFCERPKWRTSHRVNLLPDLLSGLTNHPATPIALESLRITYMSIYRADWLKEHYLGHFQLLATQGVVHWKARRACQPGIFGTRHGANRGPRLHC